MDGAEEEPPRRRGGGALAVDLRRARAAQRRADRAAQRAASPETPPSRSRGHRVACENREPLECVREWFRLHDWTPFAFQEQVWTAYLAGESGLIHAATGTGKTYAAWLGPILEWLRDYPSRPRPKPEAPPPLRVLWITPLRALAGDTEAALRAPIEDFGLPWTVQSRTGDTPARVRARQRERLPTALVTTPESLSLLLTREDASELFGHLELVVVDEWHELLASKRGVQTELALARLRQFRPSLRTLGLSATLGNLDVARDALLGLDAAGVARPGRIMPGLVPKALEVDALIPETMERFPWSGQIGLRLLPEVIAAIEEGQTSLVFTNTRATAEIWYQALLAARPDWAGIMALHHGSLDRATREWVEDGLREGRLRCVVCTSTLDLGVDFTPVDRVLQVGSPKGIGRLIQRAGRSGHRPGAVSRLTCVPTNALELVDVAAARDALDTGRIEARRPVERPLDLLAQHAVTVALGGGFVAGELFAEVRRTNAFRDLTAAEWAWVLDFITYGGNALRAYPEYSKVEVRDGRYVVTSRMVAMRHRLSIGTIVSETSMKVQFLRGRTLGSVEENFIARLRPGDHFTFAGRTLEFVRVRGLVAYVRKSTKVTSVVPHWSGVRMPISPELAIGIRAKLDEARRGIYAGREMAAVRPILELQAAWSRLPAPDELLVERVRTREGYHLFFFPIEGRLVHEGLAALFAYRMAQLGPISFTLAANDYGLELLSAEPAPIHEAIEAGLFSAAHLLHDIPASLNAAELARRQFREIARVAGLIFQGYPGVNKSVKQVQASSELLYDVFERYDPDNLLLFQAHREVLERQLEQSRLGRALDRIAGGRVTVVDVERPTPLAFGLLVDRAREQVTSEKLSDRIRRMVAPLEKAADAPRFARGRSRGFRSGS
ncbi:MAG TPA: ligase-associated DNA damage response DEXH box helicase [Gemmatimonadales bacterium]|nr:ligase-associated DNA damage response DEXH box helicase [Gemmatimonadales bacterium]